MMAHKEGGVPSGVEFYDYISTDGTAYINTGVLGNGELSSEVTFMWTRSDVFSPFAVILGTRLNTGNTRYTLSALNSNSLGIGCGVNVTLGESIGVSMERRYTVTHHTHMKSGGSSSYYEVRDSGFVSPTYTYSNIVTDTDKELFLFRNNDSTASPCNSYLRIKSVKLWSGDKVTLVRDLRPCTYNGVAGMWDMVSNEFFGNANSGGALSVFGYKLPNEYTQLNFIESSGTQYIDTGIAVSATDKPSASIIFAMANNLSGGRSFFGVNTAYNNGFSASADFSAGGRIRFAQGSIFTTSYTLVKDKVNDVQLNYDNYSINYGAYKGGITPTSAGYVSGSVLLFVARRGAEMHSASISSIRCYEFSMAKDGLEVCHLIPCYRNADGEVGMYDIVRNVFLTNEGTGTFIKGLEI